MSESPGVAMLPRLQRRVARLLLLHDRRTFRGHFRERYAASILPQLPELRSYDLFTRLVLLADELLDDLLPRIHRHLSFHASRDSLEEEPPVRGQIDWNASIERAWGAQPGHPPTRLTTQLRTRTFNTPENALVVAVLSHYAHVLARSRAGPFFPDIPMNEDEQQDLLQIENRLRRELATPHFQELTRSMPHLEDERDRSSDIAALIDAIEPSLRPGINPYRDLVTWWLRLEQLHLRSQGESQLPATVLEDQHRLDLLYQLWVTLELVEFLTDRRLIDYPYLRTDYLSFTFRWQGRSFCFVHDRQPSEAIGWEGVSGECSGALITRADGVEITYEDTLIWREPGVLVDTRCWSGEPKPWSLETIGEVIATFFLLDVTKGVLILPTSAGLQTPIHPRQERLWTTGPPDTEIHLYELHPLLPVRTLHQQLENLLNQVGDWLPDRPPIACHGIFQDADTINTSGTPPHRCSQCGSVQVFCLRPHINPAYGSLVCPRCDCLHNPRLCHVMSLDHSPTFTPPFVKRMATHEDLLTTIQTLRARLQQNVAPDDESDAANAARTVLFQTVGDLTSTYIQYARLDTGQITYLLREGFFQQFWDHATHPRGLPEDVRNMLISGDYVRSQFQQAPVKDWAACAIQYLRSLERETVRRIYGVCGRHLLNRHQQPMQPREFTFGTPGATYYRRQSKDHNPHNWHMFLTYVVTPSNADLAAFEQLLIDIDSLRQDRNRIAHAQEVDRETAERIRTAVLGEIGKPGLLRRLAEMLNLPDGDGDGR
ncbi:MAG: hypothetical protein HC884_05000 [Chloroflexaceae bacterium]|nr:hypothetical protein [Chloroflexaceae bacterium]